MNITNILEPKQIPDLTRMQHQKNREFTQRHISFLEPKIYNEIQSEFQKKIAVLARTCQSLDVVNYPHIICIN